MATKTYGVVDSLALEMNQEVCPTTTLRLSYYMSLIFVARLHIPRHWRSSLNVILFFISVTHHQNINIQTIAATLFEQQHKVGWRDRITTTQALDLSFLMPLSVVSCCRLQLGFGHWATSVTLLLLIDISPHKRSSDPERTVGPSYSYAVGTYFFLPAVLLSIFTLLFLPSSSASMFSFILTVPCASVWENTYA